MGAITEQIGRELAGRYQLEGGLGTGASAHVYLAFDRRLSRRVAIKLLHPGLSGDRQFLRRFTAEAQAVAALNHPSVVQVYDWGEEVDGPFLVLEYLAGGSLRDLLDAGFRLGPAQAARVGAAAARGLAYAHRRGFVHRDIKPENLLFDEEGEVHIADFGLARALAEAAWTEPSGAVLGTARYASPEQAEGVALDGRSDVYSLALVLYEAVTGKVPFGADTTVATLMARVGATLPPAPELGPLAAVLAQAAISEPLVRLDAEELAADLEALAQSLPTPPPIPLVAAEISRPPAPISTPTPGPALAVLPADEPTTVMAGLVAERSPAPYFDWAEDEELAAPPASGADAPGAAEPSVRRRHRGRRVLAGLLVLALLAAAGVVVVRHLPKHVDVPGVTAMSLSTAEHRIARAELRLGALSHAYSASVPAGAVIAQHPAAGGNVAPHARVHLTVSLGHAPVGVPVVVHLAEQTALAKLGAAHFSASVHPSYSETVPSGEVISASPSGLRPYGSAVSVVVSQGPAPRQIPNFAAGTTWATASAALSAERLAPVEQQQYSNDVPAGDVISTSPAEGAGGVAVGTKVSVVVSLGPLLVAVPEVKGDTIAGALAALQQQGLNVTEQVGPPLATTAVTTDPSPGTKVRPGTAVTLYVS
ncbi:MAG: PASTA domain-containing protein [Actinomycetota bacterium]|nr:PASTA domain-containing protein [Actinomycetota bacterium]